MNNRTLILIVVTAIFMIFLMINFASNTSIYTDFQTAKKSSDEVHIVAEWIKRDQSSYNAQKDEFSFFLEDSLGNEAFVIYPDPKPVNFEQAEKVVVIGKFRADTFFANKILMKCPSKYEEKKL